MSETDCDFKKMKMVSLAELQSGSYRNPLTEPEKKADSHGALQTIYRPWIEHWAKYARYFVRANRSQPLGHIPNIVWSDPIRAHPEFAGDTLKCKSLNWVPTIFKAKFDGKEGFVKVDGYFIPSKTLNSHGRLVQVWTLESYAETVAKNRREAVARGSLRKNKD